MSSLEDKSKSRATDKIVTGIKKAWTALKENEEAFTANREAWPELVMEFAKMLLAGREACRSAANGKVNDTEFGKWLKTKGVDYVKKDRRAAYINLAENEAKAMKVLQATSSKSVQIIWDEVDAWVNPNKPKSKRIVAEKAGKQERKANKAKGRSTSSKLDDVKKGEVNKADKPEPVFTVGVLPSATNDVKRWLLRRATELKAEFEEYDASIKVDLQR
jgi:hypothetical protein